MRVVARRRRCSPAEPTRAAQLLLRPSLARARSRPAAACIWPCASWSAGSPIGLGAGRLGAGVHRGDDAERERDPAGHADPQSVRSHACSPPVRARVAPTLPPRRGAGQSPAMAGTGAGRPESARTRRSVVGVGAFGAPPGGVAIPRGNAPGEVVHVLPHPPRRHGPHERPPPGQARAGQGPGGPRRARRARPAGDGPRRAQALQEGARRPPARPPRPGGGVRARQRRGARRRPRAVAPPRRPRDPGHARRADRLDARRAGAGGAPTPPARRPRRPRGSPGSETASGAGLRTTTSRSSRRACRAPTAGAAGPTAPRSPIRAARPSTSGASAPSTAGTTPGSCSPSPRARSARSPSGSRISRTGSATSTTWPCCAG